MHPPTSNNRHTSQQPNAPGRHQDEVSSGSDGVCQGCAELDNALELGVLLAEGLDQLLILGLAGTQDDNLGIAGSKLGQSLRLCGVGC